MSGKSRLPHTSHHGKTLLDTTIPKKKCMKHTSTANRLLSRFSSSHDRVWSLVSDPCVAYLPALSCCTAFAYINKVCVCVCVCATMKKRCQTNGKPNKRHRRYFKEAAASTLQRKLQQEKEARFISRSLPYLQRKKTGRSSLLNLHMLQSTCFGTWIETGVDS